MSSPILPSTTSLPIAETRPDSSVPNAHPTAQAEKVRAALTDFVGETFFRQMIKSMRTTLGRPAYFHGGRAEEVFRSQLDQALVEEMTAATASEVADPMFERQFPQLADLINEHRKSTEALADNRAKDLGRALMQLRRR